MNNILTILSLILSAFCLISFIAYMVTTTKIIRSQEKEIDQLRHNLNNEKAINREQLYISPEEPKFGGF